jgi:hypothetical protein
MSQQKRCRKSNLVILDLKRSTFNRKFDNGPKNNFYRNPLPFRLRF